MNQALPLPAKPALAGPLKTASDMAPTWRDVQSDFDAAAHAVVRAHQLDGPPRDLPLLDLRAWGVVPHHGQFALAPLGRNHPPRALRANAFAGLMTRLNAPTEFVRDRLPAALQLATANYLLASQDRPLPALLRLRGEEVAALVSDRYAPLDPEELLGTVRDVLAQQDLLGQVEVRSTATGITDVVRLVFPAEQRAIKVGDVTSVGIDISTSSFGRSAIHVRGLLWRLVCTNGLRVSERQGAYAFRHVGDSQRLRDGIAEAIPTALVQARGVMDRWRKAVHVMVEDVARQIDELRELTIPERGRVVDELKRETGRAELPEHIDLYSFLNSLTFTAQEAAPSRRLEIETLAGQLLAEKVRG